MNDNIRFIADRCNKSNIDSVVELNIRNSEYIISDTQMYDVIVEKLEIPTDKLPMDLYETPLQMVLFVDADPKPIELEKYGNVFSLPNKFYYHPEEILEEINYIINKYTHDYPLGNFFYDRTQEKFGFKTGAQNNSDNIWIMFDDRLTYMFDSFGFTPGTYTHRGVTFNQFDQPRGTNTTIYQRIGSFNNFYQFKSVRVFSTMGTSQCFIYNQNLNVIQATSLLTEISINSLTYSENQRNVLYLPNEFKLSSFARTGPLDSFDMTFKIHYANGKDFTLVMRPGAYLNISMVFKLKEIIKNNLLLKELDAETNRF